MKILVRVSYEIELNPRSAYLVVVGVDTEDDVETDDEVEALDEVEADDDVEMLDEVEIDDDVEMLDEVDTDDDVEALDDVDNEEDVEALDDVDIDEDVEALDDVDADDDVEVLDDVDAELDVETLQRDFNHSLRKQSLSLNLILKNLPVNGKRCQGFNYFYFLTIDFMIFIDFSKTKIQNIAVDINEY